MVDADTTLAELWTEYNPSFVATAAEIEAWNTLDVVGTIARLRAGKLSAPGADNTVVTYVGLFGVDLTDFLADCETSDDCDPADYDVYTGWAVGVNWSGTPANPIDGVVFTDSLWSVQVTWGEANVVEAAVVDAVTEDEPTDD